MMRLTSLNRSITKSKQRWTPTSSTSLTTTTTTTTSMEPIIRFQKSHRRLMATTTSMTTTTATTTSQRILKREYHNHHYRQSCCFNHNTRTTLTRQYHPYNRQLSTATATLQSLISSSTTNDENDDATNESLIDESRLKSQEAVTMKKHDQWIVSPMHQLHNYYRNKIKTLIFRDCFTTDETKIDDNSTRTVYKSTFTCPDTSRTFVSGRYGDAEDYVIIDGGAWYDKRKMAEHAAAMAVLEDLNMGGTMMLFWSGVRGGVVEGDGEEGDDGQNGVEAVTLVDRTGASPMNILHNYYQKRNKSFIFRDNMTTETKASIDETTGRTTTWFRSTFTCPETSRTFVSGRYGEEEDYVIIDGGAWFRKRRLAEHAAAMAVLEDLNMAGGMMSFWSGMRGDEVIEDEDDNDDDEEEANDKENDILRDNEIFSDDDNTFLSNNQSTTTQNNPSSSSSSDYIIMDAPTISPMEALVQSWTPSSSSDNNNNTPLFYRSIKKANHALSWFTRLPHPISTSSYNAILHTLAATPLDWPRTFQYRRIIDAALRRRIKVPSDVERLARELVEEMEGMESARLGEETYNAYLRCFRPMNDEEETTSSSPSSSSHSSVASRMDNYLQHLTSTTSFQPNNETYRIMIAALATSSSPTDRDKVATYMEELLSKNKTVDLATLRYALKSLTCQKTGRFDLDTARRYMDGLTEGMVAGVEEYHAPLLLRSRVNGRREWWRHEDGNETTSSTEESIRIAKSYEEWITSLTDTTGQSPTLSMYESIIQAWTRTNTPEGYLRAETLAMGILTIPGMSSSGQLPRDVVLPIVDAWSRSGTWEGARRVEEWVTKWRELGGRDDEGELTSRIVRAYGLLSERSKESEEDLRVTCAERCMAWWERLKQQQQGDERQGNKKRLSFQQSSSSVVSSYELFSHMIRSWERVSDAHPGKGRAMMSIVASINTSLPLTTINDDHDDDSSSTNSSPSSLRDRCLTAPPYDLHASAVEMMTKCPYDGHQSAFDRFIYPVVDGTLHVGLSWAYARREYEEESCRRDNHPKRQLENGDDDDDDDDGVVVSPKEYSLAVLRACRDWHSRRKVGGERERHVSDAVRVVMRVLDLWDYYHGDEMMMMSVGSMKEEDVTEVYLAMMDNIISAYMTTTTSDSTAAERDYDSKNDVNNDEMVRLLLTIYHTLHHRQKTTTATAAPHHHNGPFVDITKCKDKLLSIGINESQLTPVTVSTKQQKHASSTSMRGRSTEFTTSTAAAAVVHHHRRRRSGGKAVSSSSSSSSRSRTKAGLKKGVKRVFTRKKKMVAGGVGNGRSGE